ncbi:hypothetical protein RF11_14393 [Thelohanellus kitauei]|uniref:Uncharacterized protein n=1 Tax=Thelohanellus kitauei TaxID=669202 RepID=A0A0C2MM76_THEKT|nr:hypothetical protein RF11_14393 [Thelohanellus kitauei]
MPVYLGQSQDQDVELQQLIKVIKSNMNSYDTHDTYMQKLWNGKGEDVVFYKGNAFQARDDQGCLRFFAILRFIKKNSKLIPIHSAGPREERHLDFTGPFPTTRRGNLFILLRVDRNSRWPEAIVLPRQGAITTGRAVLELKISPHGVPNLNIMINDPSWRDKLRCRALDNGNEWDINLHVALMPLRKSKKESTGHRPF